MDIQPSGFKDRLQYFVVIGVQTIQSVCNGDQSDILMNNFTCKLMILAFWVRVWKKMDIQPSVSKEGLQYFVVIIFETILSACNGEQSYVFTFKKN